MVVPTPAALADLYLVDETAYLEQTAALIRAGRLDHVDAATLAEYLSDMARRDRKEVLSRLVVLLLHLLKWDHQPDRRSGSWMATILEQRRELAFDLDSRTLRNHAEAVLAKAYASAARDAAAETRLPADTFPADCPYTLDEVLSRPLDADPL